MNEEKDAQVDEVTPGEQEVVMSRSEILKLLRRSPQYTSYQFRQKLSKSPGRKTGRGGATRKMLRRRRRVESGKRWS